MRVAPLRLEQVVREDGEPVVVLRIDNGKAPT